MDEKYLSGIQVGYLLRSKGFKGKEYESIFKEIRSQKCIKQVITGTGLGTRHYFEEKSILDYIEKYI